MTTAMRRALALLLTGLILGAALPAAAQTPSAAVEDLRERGKAYFQAKDYREAISFYERALRLIVSELGPEHEQTSIATYSLGYVAEAAGDLATAERYLRQTLAIREKVYGADSAGVAMALESLGKVLVKARRQNEAEPLFRRALKIRQDTVGQEHAFAAVGHANLGDVALARGDWANARNAYRQAIRLVTRQDTSTAVVKALVDDEIRRFRDTFVGIAQASWELRNAPGAEPTAIFEETYTAGQQAWNTQAASALARMTARLGAGETDLGRRIRRNQDLSDRALTLNREIMQLLTDWSAVQRAHPEFMTLQERFRAASIARAREQAPTIKRQTELVQELQAIMARCPPGGARIDCRNDNARREAVSAELGRLSQQTSTGSAEIMAVHARMEAAEKALPGYATFSSRHTELRNGLAAAEREVRDARIDVTRLFPDYAALAEPQPLTRTDTQRLLREDEALVAILVGSERSFVWAVTRERAEWAQLDIGADALAREVTALRLGLDPLAQQTAEGGDGTQAGIVASFDLARSHALYGKILGPIAPLLAGKQHLLVVPTGALTSLPFQVLVTAPPAPGVSREEALRQARWLITSTAISVLPSVPSLGALRRVAAGSAAQRPFFGMGDPILQGPDPAERQRGKKRAGPPARYYRNGLADIRAVRELTPLPDTATELRAIAKALQADPDAVNLREAASETRLKATSLAQFRVIQFATHGLVAGDLSGLAEPALVLTPPDTPTELDDGLLTASEIAALKLNAEWVVLSACNTAAGESEGAEALSGLARAFFYAGARTLLVSHWAVYSQAATELTTGTFERLAARSGLGRAEAFRQSMLRLIADGRPPAYWAPFVVVGEGAALSK